MFTHTGKCLSYSVVFLSCSSTLRRLRPYTHHPLDTWPYTGLEHSTYHTTADLSDYTPRRLYTWTQLTLDSARRCSFYRSFRRQSRHRYRTRTVSFGLRACEPTARTSCWGSAIDLPGVYPSISRSACRWNSDDTRTSGPEEHMEERSCVRSSTYADRHDLPQSRWSRKVCRGHRTTRC